MQIEIEALDFNLAGDAQPHGFFDGQQQPVAHDGAPGGDNHATEGLDQQLPAVAFNQA
jgi:hypothetical protein